MTRTPLVRTLGKGTQIYLKLSIFTIQSVTSAYFIFLVIYKVKFLN